MPNAINRYQPNQTLKLEKECENNDIVRRKIRSMNNNKNKLMLSNTPNCLTHQQTVGRLASSNNINLHRLEKLLNPKTESVWERLSKVKKCSSHDGSLSGGGGRSRHNLVSKSSSQRLPTLRPTGPCTLRKTSMYPNMKRNGDKTMLKNKKKPNKCGYSNEKTTDNIPYINNAGQHLKEIFTARSVCHSKSSSEDSKRSAPRKIFMPKTTQDDIYFTPGSIFEVGGELDLGSLHFGCSHDSFDNYELAPLVSMPTKDSTNSSSAHISNNFREILEQKKHKMEPDEIKLIKNVIKTDDRHRNLRKNNSELFRDILKTQLQEILRQESVVKSALSKLESPRNEAIEAESYILEKTVEYGDPETEKKPQVDVIFKNVPTLEKEIIILRALGEKLEATLRRSESIRSLTVIERKTTATSTSSISARSMHSDHSGMRTLRSSTPSPLLLTPLSQRVYETIQCVGFVFTVSQIYVIRVAKGLRIINGFAQEYRIAIKSIVQLKKEAHKHFYLPASEDSTDLKRTTFQKLKTNPDVLMRFLKPKKTVSFNFLEQDSIFFNSYGSEGNLRDMKFPEVTHSDEPSEESEDSIESKKLYEGNKAYVTLPVDKDEKDHDLYRIPELLKIKENFHLPYDLLEASSRDLKLKHVGFRKLGTHEADIQNLQHLFVRPMVRYYESVAENSSSISKPKQYAKYENKFLNDMRRGRTVLKADLPEHVCTPTLNMTNEPKSIKPETLKIGKKRRRQAKRTTTPLDDEKFVNPKNNLLKTILVGSVQVSVFIILIMAITFPDAKC